MRDCGQGFTLPYYYGENGVTKGFPDGLPAMQETWVWSLGGKIPWREGMAMHSSTLVWRILWTEAWQATVCEDHKDTESDTAEGLSSSGSVNQT